jgi:hypothetical protein
VIKGKFMTLSAYIRNEEMSQMTNLSSHLKNLEPEQQNKPKASRRKQKSMKLKTEKQ